MISTPEAALARLRELAAAGVHDRQIAKRLDAEGFVTGMGKRWNLDTVRNMRSRHQIPSTAPSLPTATPVPDRREDGCYSVLGAARHFGVDKDVIRRWIDQGAVRVSREPGKTGTRGALWLHVDQETEARLVVLADDARRRCDCRRKGRANGPTTST